MGSILNLKRKVEAFNSEIAIIQVMQACEDDIGDLNKEQMYAGKTNKGTDIRPSYFEDPYFKTRAQAQAYSDWKDKITPSPRRNPGTPNLIINGYYYANRKVQVIGDKIVYYNTYAAFGDKIADKYKDINGLGGEHKKIFLRDYYSPLLRERITKEIGLKFK